MVLILSITVPLLWRSIPLFEALLGILIGTPILWFLLFTILRSLGMVSIASLDSASGYLGYVFLLAFFLAGIFGLTKKKKFSVEEIYPVILFSAVFSFCYALSLSWADFIPMGERLRDYALLSASINNPLDPEEPWMSGAVLNYYPFWYRFGHMLHTLLLEPTWNVYHIMMSFSMAAYATIVFRVLQVVIGFAWLPALIGALAISFGSNVSGIIAAWNKDDGWWGPSRVIAGAINEFPAWSFILGDLHPHYLNLSFIPFALLVLHHVSRSALPVFEKNLYLVVLSILPLLFLFEANPWEMPMWAGYCVLALGFSLIHSTSFPDSKLKAWYRSQSFNEKAQFISGVVVSVITFLALLVFRKNLSLLYQILILAVYILYMVYFVLRAPDVERLKRAISRLPCKRTCAVLTVFGLLALSLYLATSHIKPEGGTLKLVRPPILRTTISELFLHWGVPITILSLSSVLVLPGLFTAALTGLMLILSCVTGEAMIFIYTLIILQLVRLFLSGGKIQNVFAEAILLSGLGLILLPEILFLDDPYGGENERMNTIFKIYTTAWFMLHVGSLYIASLCYHKKMEHL